MDFLTTAGYSKLGIPGNMTPNPAQPGRPAVRRGDASMKRLLRGMNMRTQAATRAGTNGTIIAARSENDTGNNPHNPMYGIARTGSRGELLTLIGSVSSDSGGNSIGPGGRWSIRRSGPPRWIGRAITGLVDTGELGTLFPNPADAVSVMESMAVLTHPEHAAVTTGLATDANIKQFNKCGYVKSAYLAERFSSPAALNPSLDARIVGPGGIFTQAEYDGDREFQKTAAVMKMVIDGNAGAGTIQMGGFDSTGDRSPAKCATCAGQCIGAALNTRRAWRPVML
jgi:hypothetical protein